MPKRCPQLRGSGAGYMKRTGSQTLPWKASLSPSRPPGQNYLRSIYFNTAHSTYLEHFKTPGHSQSCIWNARLLNNFNKPGQISNMPKTPPALSPLRKMMHGQGRVGQSNWPRLNTKPKLQMQRHLIQILSASLSIFIIDRIFFILKVKYPC